MTEMLLRIAARPGAPIACDMSTASDTPEERRAAYARLFEALVSRERRDDGVAFRLRAGDGVRAALEDLARREAACCPFADYRVEAAGDELIWTITAAAPAALDAFYALSA
jgi:hypothetical protein